MILFWRESTPVSAVTAEIYRLIASPTLPAIPLLTATGFVLAETQAPQRLVRFFHALFGFMPGGVAVLVSAVCALFTAFTGGSGVTIIALGGLVYPILIEDGYSERFSLGLVTAAGSLGLLFPPSLPVILYSVVAKVPADQLFIAGLVPGLMLLLLVAAYGISVGRKLQTQRQPFMWRELLAATWEAKWELSIPLVMVAAVRYRARFAAGDFRVRLRLHYRHRLLHPAGPAPVPGAAAGAAEGHRARGRGADPAQLRHGTHQLPGGCPGPRPVAGHGSDPVSTRRWSSCSRSMSCCWCWEACSKSFPPSSS